MTAAAALPTAHSLNVCVCEVDQGISLVAMLMIFFALVAILFAIWQYYKPKSRTAVKKAGRVAPTVGAPGPLFSYVRSVFRPKPFYICTFSHGLQDLL